jgi:hypothetical protein
MKKKQCDIVATATTLVAVTLFFTGCNRVQDGQSAKPATAGIAQSGPRAPQLPAPVQTVPQTQSSLSLSPTPAVEVAPKSEAPLAKLIPSDRSQTLIVAQQTFRLLTHVQSIEGTSEDTVEWWELRDANERVIYRESYPVALENGTFQSTTWISANSFTSTQGSGILISGMDLPSAPDSGGWVQVFGFKYGRGQYGADPSLFDRFGPPILVNGEFLGVDTDSSRPTPPSVRGATATVMHDVLKFRLWTGNVNIVYPVLVNWIAGKLQPAWRCIETTSKGRVERCSYPITVDAQRDNQPTFVRLFPEPDDGFTPKHVIVQPQSKIEYLEGRMPVVWNEDAKAIYFSVNGDVWLKVRIDGLDGWIRGEEDFEAVGLPQAG